MILRLIPIYDADTGDTIRFDVQVCCYKNNEGQELFLFVDSFAPNHPIKDIQRKADSFLARASTQKLVEVFCERLKTTLENKANETEVY